MNRTDRLFAMVVRLQSRRRVRAEDLAAEFGVSRRTIYRDIVALNEAGIPIVSLPGLGYELVEGFFLPPLRFTLAEASALIFGARLLREQAAGTMAIGAEQAIAKILAALRERTREAVGDLTEAIAFLTPPARFDVDDPRVAELYRAIRDRRVLWLRYHSRSRDETSAREVEPDRLVYSDGVWYLTGYCRLRQARRTFRLNRIEALALRGETFTPRPEAAAEADDSRIAVRVRVASNEARWVRERQHYSFQYEESVGVDPDSPVYMVYAVDELSEIVPWLRSWGPAVEVLTPSDLRRIMRDEAQQITELLT